MKVLLAIDGSAHSEAAVAARHHLQGDSVRRSDGAVGARRERVMIGDIIHGSATTRVAIFGRIDGCGGAPRSEAAAVSDITS